MDTDRLKYPSTQQWGNHKPEITWGNWEMHKNTYIPPAGWSRKIPIYYGKLPSKKLLSKLHRSKKLEALQEYSRLKIKKVKKFSHKRAEYIAQVRDRIHKKWAGQKCFVCRKDVIEVLHHIIMISLGGSNRESNLIGICIPCHADIHPWLKDHVEDEIK